MPLVPTPAPAPAPRSLFRLRPFLALSFLVLASCAAHDPPGSPQATCRLACAQKSPHCSSTECARGCSLTVDRISEHEEDHVLDCMAKASACDDPSWSRCATLVGPHADGGPPPPPPPKEDFE